LWQQGRAILFFSARYGVNNTPFGAFPIGHLALARDVFPR
jgi:hypothetical protein